MKDNKEDSHKKTVVVGPNFLAHWYVYDYERCANEAALKKVMNYINYHGYDIVGVTQDSNNVFTVFFRRRACG